MIEVSPDLLAFLREEYARCRDDTLEDERQTAIDRYNGEPYGDEEEGYSQVVARDTAETVDYMVISILRTIVSGDRVVEFVHKNSEAAHQATETIMHLLMDDQDGYSILHDWLKAGLLEKNAVAMTYPEVIKKRVSQEGISELQLVAFEQQAKESGEFFKVIEKEKSDQTDEYGEPLINITALVDSPPKFCDAAVPNGEFYCSPDARTVTEAAMKGRKVRKTISDLVAEGMDADELETVGDIEEDTLLEQARDEYRNTDVGDRKGANRVVQWHEEFVRFDEDGDGIAELIYIQRSSDFKIFGLYPMDDIEDHPFEDWSPFPMQHRRIGQSLADKVMDIERVRTVLFRQSLNGIYLANNPSTYVHEDAIGENTIEDLLTVRPGRLVRWKGGVEPKERSGQFDASNGFTMLEFMNGERESRTGITRLNQGLDADALNKTATGTALMQAQGQQVEEYLARNFANALARLFTKKARLLKRYGKPMMVPIDGEFTEVDPTQWPEDMIARPRVGLGSGRKEQRIAFRRELIGMQSMAFEAGMGIVDEQKFFNSAKGFVSDVGLGSIDEFFDDPSKPQIDPATGQPKQKQEKPDPEMAKVQAEAQLKQADQQAKQQEAAAKLQMSQAEGQAKMQLAAREAQAKIQLMREEASAKLQFEREKAQFEANLAVQKMEREFALAERQMEIDSSLAAQRNANDHDAKVQKNREGGDLSK